MLLEWGISQAQRMILILVHLRSLLIFLSHIDFHALVAGNVQDLREHDDLVFDFKTHFFGASIYLRDKLLPFPLASPFDFIVLVHLVIHLDEALVDVLGSSNYLVDAAYVCSCLEALAQGASSSALPNERILRLLDLLHVLQ